MADGTPPLAYAVRHRRFDLGKDDCGMTNITS